MWPLTLLLIGLMILFQTPQDRPHRVEKPEQAVTRAQPDWQALKTIPVRNVVEFATLDDDIDLFSMKRHDATARKIEALPPERRDLVWLAMLAQHMGPVEDGQDQSLHSFFFLAYGDVAPQVLSALERTGLSERARVFSEAMALCGTPYPTDHDVRKRSFAWSKPGRITGNEAWPHKPNAFDRRLFALGSAFGDRNATWAAIEGVIARDAGLTHWVDEERAAMSDAHRLDYLFRKLFVSGEMNEAAFAGWPRAYRTIYLLSLFNSETTYVGMRAFFCDASGNLAPQVAQALREIGLPKRAEAVEHGIALFENPYPVDTERRRAFVDQSKPEFGKALENLTGQVDDEEIPRALVELAKREGILPH